MFLDNASDMHSWAHDRDNAWQELTPQKIDPNDNKSAWLIFNSNSNLKRYPEFRDSNDSTRPTCYPREYDTDTKSYQEWLIRSNGPGRWMSVELSML